MSRPVSKLYIEQLNAGPASGHSYVGKEANAIFTAIKKRIVPTEIRLLIVTGREREGQHFISTADTNVRLGPPSATKTIFVRTGDIIVCTNGS